MTETDTAISSAGFAVLDRVVHGSLGAGTVRRLSPMCDWLTVDFDRGPDCRFVVFSEECVLERSAESSDA